MSMLSHSVDFSDSLKNVLRSCDGQAKAVPFFIQML